MRKNLTIPSVEALKRAFRSVKCLTEYDAVILANDASGNTNCQVSAGVGARRIWAGRLARKAWTFFRSACKASW